MPVRDARRHVDRTLSELAAEYGRVEVVRERHEVDARMYERLCDRADAFDGCGGAGAWVRDPDGRVLLVETDEGWAEPAAELRPGEEYVETAEAAVRRQTGLEPVLAGVERVHVRYLADWTDRDPLPQPFVVFAARASGRPAGDAAWHDRLPDETLYEYLSALSLDGEVVEK
jgi:ADP-ribose pyrophosphatase YjhB (NUDIX family)